MAVGANLLQSLHALSVVRSIDFIELPPESLSGRLGRVRDLPMNVTRLCLARRLGYKIASSKRHSLREIGRRVGDKSDVVLLQSRIHMSAQVATSKPSRFVSY
jgi:hypothetical protein